MNKTIRLSLLAAAAIAVLFAGALTASAAPGLEVTCDDPHSPRVPAPLWQ